MEYELNQIESPKKFQRLVNTILVARFGEDARLTPLKGPDGGFDGETAPENPYMEFHYTGKNPPSHDFHSPPRPGRYLFQAKYHPTGEHRPSDLRTQVIREFRHHLQATLRDPVRKDADYFFLVTNLSSSQKALEALDEVRRHLLGDQPRPHADIWWHEAITAHLDLFPQLWHVFPEVFPGRTLPLLGQALTPNTEGLANRFGIALSTQYNRDRNVKFRQVELEHNLFGLFVDLPVRVPPPSDDHHSSLSTRSSHGLLGNQETLLHRTDSMSQPSTGLELLLQDRPSSARILLEGGPGQGKSTITQMAAQLYRARLLERSEPCPARLPRMTKPRFPFRIELRSLADWFSQNPGASFDEYLARTIAQDSGGTSVTVDDIHAFVLRSPLILLLDGLDEIGEDSLRDTVIEKVTDTIQRFQDPPLDADLRVVLTTRPPALTGRRDRLSGFVPAVLSPMDPSRIDQYLHQWLSAQIPTPQDRDRITGSFESRRYDPHVDALARNPMQLSVLLQFIYLKGDAFPDRRAELYRDYFQIVIDRDVEKSPDLRENRELIEGLHSFLGFYFHGAAEVQQSARNLNRQDIIDLAGTWLQAEGHPKSVAERFFALGEERFGLIVALSGEGDATTYGFEVQPIQEYFAASYISNRLAEGSAHEIFGLLIPLDYWREVGLFLAGLRRPNEKADLIARARAADHGESTPWKQNGRSVVLQLLREGVFHQARHVQTTALDFVSELLELPRLRLQRSPHALLDTMGQIAGLYDVEPLRAQIAHSADCHSSSSDEHALAALHQLAANLLPNDQYVDLVLRYSGASPKARSLVRLTCPYGSIDSFMELTSDPEYWEGVPAAIWATRLWRAALQHQLVRDMVYPPDLHASLVVEFATDYRMDLARDISVIDIQSRRPQAVWKLQQNLQLIRMHSISEMEGSRSGSASIAPSPMPNSVYFPDGVDYSGLPSPLASCLRDLIDATDSILLSLAEPDRSPGESVNEYAKAVSRHLKDAGLSGWVACRCAAELLRYMGPFASRGLPKGYMESLRQFFPLEHAPASYRRFYHGGFPLTMPFAVRLRRREVPVPLDQVIIDTLEGRVGRRHPCPWIADIPLPAMTIGLLIRNRRVDLSRVLRFIGNRRSVRHPHQRRLMVQDSLRILKLCRGTCDLQLLEGAASVLANAAISRIAEPELIAKLLGAAPASELLPRVFGSARKYPDMEPGTQDGDSTAARLVAQVVLGNPGGYPFRVVTEAVSFLAESEASAGTPLFRQRPDLELPGT